MHFDYAQCKQKGFAPILILVGILIIAAVAGGAYFLGKQATPKTSQSLQPITTSQPSPIPDEIASSDPSVANWRTYTNIKYGFSFKYPDEYLPFGFNGDKFTLATPMDTKVTVDVAADRIMREPVLWFEIETTEKTARELTNEWLKKYPHNQPLVRDIIFGGKPAIEGRGQTGGYNFPYRLIIIPRNGFLMMITQALEEPLLDAILSTFKFIN